jgi:hypothetical protein
MYYYFVVNYANPIALLHSVWSYKMRIFATALPLFIIRGLFLRRVHRLSEGNKILTWGLFAVNLVNLVAALAVTVKLFGQSTDARSPSINDYLYLLFATGVIAEAGIASSLCYYLHQARTGFESTEGLINILMIYIIQTGMTTVILGLLSLICYVTMTDTVIYLPFYLVLSKLYLNSYLLSLIARDALRDRSKQQTLSINIPEDTHSQTSQISADIAEGQCPSLIHVEKMALTDSSDTNHGPIV